MRFRSPLRRVRLVLPPFGAQFMDSAGRVAGLEEVGERGVREAGETLVFAQIEGENGLGWRSQLGSST